MRPRCALRLQPRLDRGVLRVEVRQIRHQILHHRHVRQRIDADVAGRQFVQPLGAGQRVLAVDVHRARTAHAFAAGPAQGQRRVDLVLDLQQHVQDHRRARDVDLEGVHARIAADVGIPAVHLEIAHLLGAGLGGKTLALLHLRHLRQCEFSHLGSLVVEACLQATIARRRAPTKSINTPASSAARS